MSESKRPFRGFVQWLPLSIYRRHLPHWRQRGGTYFVTFRLADSIPRNILARWEDERHVWYLAHGLESSLPAVEWHRKYLQISEEERVSFERDQSRQLLRELDRCHGCCLLNKPGAAAKVAEALRYFEGERIQCGDFVVMPNHVHWLVMPLGEYELEEVLQSIKRFISTRMNKLCLRPAGRLWQSETYDHLVRDSAELVRIRRYIRENPAKSGVQIEEKAYHRADWLDL